MICVSVMYPTRRASASTMVTMSRSIGLLVMDQLASVIVRYAKILPGLSGLAPGSEPLFAGVGNLWLQ